MTALWLDTNELTGPIPPELGQLTNLTGVGLSSNRLIGSIPPELGQLNQLTALRLSWNDLTGSIPEELGLLTQLQQLNLGGNRLTGSIPTELGQLTHLTELGLSLNELGGAIPPELGLWTQLSVLNLGGNRLTGPIPAELGQLTQLTRLWLYGNELIGPIPEELALLTQLEVLSISNNRLTGTIPWSLWDRSDRGELTFYFSGNLLAGVAAPPARSRPMFSGTVAENGNASHHSVSLYQGPLTWGMELGRRPGRASAAALGPLGPALAVRIDHETPTAPIVVTRVLDSRNSVLANRLSEAAPPTTQSTGENQWRTEYVFDLPGSLYQAGNQVVHVIDPDNHLPETNEDDNVGTAIRLYG